MKRHVLLAGLFLLGACGSPGAQPPRVASISSPPQASSAPAQTRPQLRLDTSDEERDRLFLVYDDCLVAHGVKVNPVDQPGPAGPGRRLDQSGEPRSAYTACKNKLPLQPPELDEDRNPNFAAQWNDHVKCLRAHGVMVHVTNPGEWTWDTSDTPIPDNMEALEKQCELEVFGGK